ncbi:MAG TPA: phosphoribosylamine--glycine ligase, partial [Pseudomonas sp.]|nr:phosphoribosylamine--glycine ligase [Pseudomonas sp.]
QTRYRVCVSSAEARDVIASGEFGFPVVLKADGLAAGKGVIVCRSLEEADQALALCFEERAFGDSGLTVVVEEFLEGEEASFFALCDGETAIALASAQDHKRVGDGDTGPNTGGMGAYSPAPVVTSEVHKRVMDLVIWPTVRGMAEEGNVYTGFLYAGLMIDKAGNPKVIEFNCRFGDPETQPVMLRLQSSLVLLVEAALAQALDKVEAQWDPRPSVGIVLAAGGYPGDYAKGAAINGLDAAATLEGKVFHAGTALKDGQVVTAGGRVLCATAMGASVDAAQQQAYKLAAEINWEGCFYRKDIGYRAIARERGVNQE